MVLKNHETIFEANTKCILINYGVDNKGLRHKITMFEMKHILCNLDFKFKFKKSKIKIFQQML